MILSIAFALMLAQAAPAPEPEGKCSIEGKVANALTGEALARAIVLLRGVAPDTAGLSFRAETDAIGAFTLRNINPGRYRLEAQRAGFVDQVFGAKRANREGTPLALQPGLAMKDVVIKMSPHGVVTGHITSPDAEPIANVPVSLTRITYDRNGQKQLTDFNSVTTNDLGEYRIFNIPPGRYFLKAALRPAPTTSSDGKAGDVETFAPTWYSGTTDPRAALPLEIQPGQTISGVDMALLKTAERRVRGIVDSRNSGPPGLVRIALVPRNSTLNVMPQSSVTIRDSDTGFAMQAPPGSYFVVAEKAVGRARFTGAAAVDVTTYDIEDLALTLQPPIEIPGNLRIAGADNLEAFSNLNVQVVAAPRELVTDAAIAPVMPDGTFTLVTTGLDSYDIHVTGMPPGYYVKSVQHAQQDVLKTGLSYTQPSDLLDIVVSPNAATVTGVVHNKGGEPIPGATVLLAPAPDKRDRASNFRVTITDQTGYFAIISLAPGDYTLFAWDDIQPGEYFDPDVLKSVEGRGQNLNLLEGAQEVVNYDVITAAETPATPAKQ